MFDVQELFVSAAKVAKLIAAAAIPGAGPIIAAGEAAIANLEKLKETFSEDDPAVLNDAIDELRPMVNAHIDSTIDKLRG